MRENLHNRAQTTKIKWRSNPSTKNLKKKKSLGLSSILIKAEAKTKSKHLYSFSELVLAVMKDVPNVQAAGSNLLYKDAPSSSCWPSSTAGVNNAGSSVIKLPMRAHPLLHWEWCFHCFHSCKWSVKGADQELFHSSFTEASKPLTYAAASGRGRDIPTLMKSTWSSCLHTVTHPLLQVA